MHVCGSDTDGGQHRSDHPFADSRRVVAGTGLDGDRRALVDRRADASSAGASSTEGNDVAGPYTGYPGGGLFDFLGIDVAPADNDQILGPPADDKFTIGEIAEVACGQPSVSGTLDPVAGRLVVSVIGGVCFGEIPGGDRSAGHLNLTDGPFRSFRTGVRVDDAYLDAGNRRPEPHQPPYPPAARGNW